jgi:thiosulfate/3-mercaptopyruvate sulfurtransferase
MKKTGFILFAAAILLVFASSVFGRDISPLVSGDWLEKNLSNPKLVMVDIRKVEEYKETHIPHSINVFYGTWAIKKSGLDNEVPEEDDLFDIIGSSGIKADSLVVVIGKADALTELVGMTRVAWTLMYGGVENVAVLDGGFNKWSSDKRPLSAEASKPKAAEYKGKVNKGLLVTKDYVLGKIGESAIADTRLPDAFFGVVKLDLVAKAGHLKGAADLPSAWIFTKEGTFKSKDELEAMAAGVVGKDRSKEMIVYCDTGKLASGWSYVLREVLGYRQVRSYDGSMQEWAKDPNAPIVKYAW